MKALERSIGLGSVVAITLGSMLGGLFILPGLAVSLTGPTAWLAYLVAGLSVLPAALCKAELATSMPVSGGTYVYIDRTFGPFAGTVLGLGLWLSLLLKSSFALVGFGAYLYVFAEVPGRIVALGLLALVVTLNILGIRKVGKVQMAIVALSLAALLLLSLWGTIEFDSELLAPSFPSGGVGFFSAVAFLYVSYAGVTKIAAISEEIKNPKRNLPLGMLISLALIVLIFSGVTLMDALRPPQWFDLHEMSDEIMRNRLSTGMPPATVAHRIKIGPTDESQSQDSNPPIAAIFSPQVDPAVLPDGRRSVIRVQILAALAGAEIAQATTAPTDVPTFAIPLGLALSAGNRFDSHPAGAGSVLGQSQERVPESHSTPLSPDLHIFIAAVKNAFVQILEAGRRMYDAVIQFVRPGNNEGQGNNNTPETHSSSGGQGSNQGAHRQNSSGSSFPLFASDGL